MFKHPMQPWCQIISEHRRVFDLKIDMVFYYNVYHINLKTLKSILVVYGFPVTSARHSFLHAKLY